MSFRTKLVLAFSLSAICILLVINRPSKRSLPIPKPTPTKSTPNAAAESATSLPLFLPQLNYLLALFALKKPGRILLLEGAPGIGKGYALQTHCLRSSSPAYYLKLSHVSSPTIQEALCDLLKIDYSQASSINCTLAVDDIQLLIADSGEISTKFPDIQEFFTFLNVLNESGSNVFVCSSNKSVLGVIQSHLSPISFMSAESVPDHVIRKYILEVVNPTISVPFRLSPRGTGLFIETFAGNLSQLADYIDASIPLYGTFILHRIH